MTEHLFSYGTLQLTVMREADFSHALAMHPEELLRGFRVDTVRVTGPEVIDASESDQHPILRDSPHAGDVVQRSVLKLSPNELRRR